MVAPAAPRGTIVRNGPRRALLRVGIPTVLTVLVVVASGTTPAAPVSGSVWSGAASATQVGCGTVASQGVHFSTSSGRGEWRGSARSTSCSAAFGGPNTTSYSNASGAVTVVTPVSIPAGPRLSYGGANATWRITLAASESVPSALPSACPRTVTQSSIPLRNGQYVNETSLTVDCVAVAVVGVEVSAEVEEVGASVSVAAPSVLVANRSGDAFVGSDTWDNYSAPSKWIDNFTLLGISSSVNGSRGALAPSFTVTVRVHADFLQYNETGATRYELVTTVNSWAYTELVGFSGLTAHAVVGPRTAGVGFRLVKISSW